MGKAKGKEIVLVKEIYQEDGKAIKDIIKQSFYCFVKREMLKQLEENELEEGEGEELKI